MVAKFDTDVAGAVLEWGVLHKQGRPNERADWERVNVLVGTGDVWRAAALEVSHLEGILGPRRDRQQVGQKLRRAFRKLESEFLIEPLSTDDNPRSLLREVTSLGKELVADGTHVEYLGGLTQVLKRRSPSVVMIYNPNGEGIGTGFVVGERTIATAAHVLEDLPRHAFCLEADRGTSREYSAKSLRVPKQRRRGGGPEFDVGIVEFDQDLGVEPMRISEHVDVLDEVLVLGYPPVSQATDTPLLAHRGEISAETKLYSDFQVLITSCLTRGGHSGGPVLNRRGEVVGIVSGNLSNEALGGVDGLGHSAVVPSVWLQDCLAGTVELRAVDEG